jgi:hypothetical protein
MKGTMRDTDKGRNLGTNRRYCGTIKGRKI